MKKIVYNLSVLLLLLHLVSYWVNMDGIIAIITSMYMPICFAFFFRKIDVFEQEEWKNLLLVFLISCATLIIYAPFIPFIHSSFNISISNVTDISFLNMFFGVAIPEEIVKIIPVLIVLKKTKFINEPIDYIIYSSISALGFAFIENIGYIYSHLNKDINIIAVRSFFPTLMHMCTTSMIGFQLYNLERKKQSQGVKKFYFLYVALSFFIAALSHTIYNCFDSTFVLIILCVCYAVFIKETMQASPFIDITKINKELDDKNNLKASGYNQFYIYMVFGVLLMDIGFGYMHNGKINLNILGNLAIIIILFSIIINSGLDGIKEIYNKLTKKDPR